MNNLPVDVLENIANFLEADDVLALTKTSKCWKFVATDSRLWAKLLLTEYPAEIIPSGLLKCLKNGDDLDWQRVYEKLLLRRTALQCGSQDLTQMVPESESNLGKSLFFDGRTFTNFNTSFLRLSPGSYRVMWRVKMLKKFYKGYFNFTANFTEPSKISIRETVLESLRLPMLEQNSADQPRQQQNTKRKLFRYPNAFRGCYVSKWSPIDPDNVGRNKFVDICVGMLQVRKGCDVTLKCYAVQTEPSDEAGWFGYERGILVDHVELVKDGPGKRPSIGALLLSCAGYPKVNLSSSVYDKDMKTMSLSDAQIHSNPLVGA